MSLVGPFVLCIAFIAVLWLRLEGVAEAPWRHEGAIAAYGPRRNGAPAKAALIIFLAVASTLFALMTAAFFMRMDSADWVLPAPPPILWLNTAVLIASSISLEAARREARSGEFAKLNNLLAIAAMTSAFFLFGQLWAWRQMLAEGLYAASNPANAFFFLLTGVHGLHLLGGLAALTLTLILARENDKERLTSNISLCAIYWHFLLAVWMLLFALLFGWADNIGAICRRLLT